MLLMLVTRIVIYLGVGSAVRNLWQVLMLQWVFGQNVNIEWSGQSRRSSLTAEAILK